MDLRKLSVGLLLGATLSFQAAPANAVTPNEGFHQHLEFANHPIDGVPIPREARTILVTVKLHKYPGHLEWLRVSDYGTVKKSIPLTGPYSLGPCEDCQVTIPFTVDFSTWAVGRHEVRWSSNDNDALPGKRQYPTSRFQVCIASCLPKHDRTQTNFLGGGGWYEGHDYVTALLMSPQSTVVPGGKIIIRSQYARSKSLCVFVNPDFHHGSRGLQLQCWGSGTAERTLTLPSSLVAGDNLVILSDDGFEGGVLHLRISQPNYLETQTWWAETGLVLP